jgi:transposase
VTGAADIKGITEHLRKVLTDGRVDEALGMVESLLAQLRARNTELELQILKLKKHQFGQRSEKVDPDQLALFLSQAQAESNEIDAAVKAILEAAAPGPETPIPAPKPRPRQGHGRKPLPAHLPREEIILEPAAEEKICATCGGEKACIGYERSEVLEFVPATFKVIEYARAKCACRKCGDGVVIAPPAAKPIDGGLPGPGLLAHVLVSKYKDHLPLHRLSGIYARSGVDLKASTLGDWVTAGTDALDPIARAIWRNALGAHLLQSDDTGIKVLDKDHPNGVKRGHLWVYLGDGRWSAFVYTPDWKGEWPQSFLAERKGWLQVDGYAGYDDLFTREGATAIEVSCWAHARRGFVETLEAGDLRAAIPVELIRQLYAIERAATDAGEDHEARRERRQREAPPIIAALGRWMADTYNKEPPKSPLAKACYYAIARWEGLKRFLEDGRLPLDNTASERALRQVAVGRNNYLFAGSDQGGERAAIAYTVIGTCMLAGVDPLAYLTDVFQKLAAGWPHRRLDELLPPNWAASRAAELTAASPVAE